MGCASTPPEVAIVEDAASALGGTEGILAASTLVIEGTGENGNFGQNMSPDATLPIVKVSELRRSIDFANGRWRQQQTVTPTFVTANTAPQTQIAGVDGDVGYNVAANGNPNRVAADVAKDRRMELYHHPVGALRAALAEGAQLANPRTEGTTAVVDVTTAQGDKFTLYTDSTTKLPLKVVSVTAPLGNNPFGDTTIETTFADYKDLNGLMLPSRLTTNRDKYTIADIQISASTVNADAADTAAPEAAKSAAAPTVPAPTVTSEQVGRGVWYLAGQSHHSVLVEFADYLALIEAPQNEARVNAVLAKVKELQPNKPLRYVVNTHHHVDHSGGIRRAMAEGATIITHAINKPFYETIARRPFTVNPDELSRNPKPPVIEAVTDKYELKDATRTIEIYPVTGNQHAETMLMVYFPAERLLVEADLYTPPAPNAPPPPGFPFAGSVVENVQKLGLRVDRVMPIHGFIAPYRNLEAAARAQKS
jgi:glyoxylase-like metal-dependent hydrolase (beta-lactamase superfamily II)